MYYKYASYFIIALIINKANLIIHFYKSVLHQMLGRPSSSFTLLSTYCTHPFLFSHFCFHYFWLCQLTLMLFFELTFVMQTIYPIIFKFIFAISFPALAWLALLEFSSFPHRSCLSNDKANIYCCQDTICRCQDFKYKSHCSANNRCD